MKDLTKELLSICGVVLVILAILTLLQGCGTKINNPERLVVKTDIVEKNVLVGCEIPKVECEFKGEGFIPTEKLLDCVQKQKKALEVCSEQVKSVD